MQRSRIILLVAPILCGSNAESQQFAAINDYLKPIVSEIFKSPNVGGWNWQTNGNGGYLIRKSMDVTGDGRDELFIATTLHSNKHTHVWTVFDIAANGKMRTYSKTLQFSFAWPFHSDRSTSLVYIAPPENERLRLSDEKPYPLHQFKFEFPEIQESVSYVSEAEKAKFHPDPAEPPKVESILLADYLADPERNWTPGAAWILDANDCLFHSGDRERAIINTNFTPQEALARLGVAENPGQREQKRGFPPMAQINVPEAEKTPGISDQPNANPQFSVRAYLIVTILLAMVLIVSWLKWRKA